MFIHLSLHYFPFLFCSFPINLLNYSAILDHSLGPFFSTMKFKTSSSYYVQAFFILIVLILELLNSLSFSADLTFPTLIYVLKTLLAGILPALLFSKMIFLPNCESLLLYVFRRSTIC